MTWALVDIENFYVSAERLFDPSLRGIPVVVLSNNDLCAISRSAEAKAMGVEMGAPLSRIRREAALADMATRSSNYELYADLNRRFNKVLAQHSATVEVYSIDESFVRLDRLSDGRGDREAGLVLKAAVMRSTGLPVRVGLGPTKTLCKVANAMAKKDVGGTGGVASLHDGDDRASLLAGWPVGKVWGIASGMTRRLTPHGIATAADLAAMPHALARKVGGVVLERLVLELGGISCHEMDEAIPQRATSSATRQTGAPVVDVDALHEAICRRILDAAAKLRAEGLVAGRFICFAHGSDRRPNPPCWTLSSPLDPATADPRPMMAIARAMAKAMFKRGDVYTKTGVLLEDVHRAGTAQAGLFSTPASPASDKLMAAMDAINAKFGRATVTIAAAGIGARDHDTRRAMKSPSWTTQMDDIPVAR